MNILVDYLTMSIKDYDVNVLIKELHLDSVPLQETGAINFCTNSFTYCGIKICYNKSFTFPVSDIIILEMSGRGCRTLETLFNLDFNWIEFLKYYFNLDDINNFSKSRCHVSRIDIACDDKPGNDEVPILNMHDIFDCAVYRKYISLSSIPPLMKSIREEDVYFGSSKSDRMVRIYNKALEKKVDCHWIRVEIQLRNKQAMSFVLKLFEIGDIGTLYRGYLFDYLRFTTSVNLLDGNQKRLVICDWWLKFLDNSKKIKGFYIGGSEYNLESLEKFLSRQAASSIITYLTLHNGQVGDLLDLISVSSLNP